jgi:O-antigen/teichoic acid export membrane protein
MRGMAVPAAARNILTGTAAKYVLLAVNIAIGIFLMPFTVGKLGKPEYGLWMMVASMTVYFQLLDLGYGSGLVRHITEADARGDEKAVNEVASTFVLVYSVIGLVAAAGTLFVAFVVLPAFSTLSADQVQTARWVMLVLGARAAIGFPMTVFGAVTTSRQYFALNTSIAVVVSLLSALATYVVLESGHGLLTLVCTTTAISLLAYIAYARAARIAYPRLRIRRSLFSRVRLREVTSFSLYLFVIDISIQIGFNLDNLVVGAFLGTSAVATYAVASRLADYQRQLCNQFNGLLFPVVVGFGARGERSALRSMLDDGTRIALGLVTGVTVCLVAFGEPLVLRWMGHGFSESLWPFYILAVAGVVLVGQGPLGSILLGTGRHRLVAFASLAEALVNLGLSVWLVRYWGVAGVALGTAIPVIVVNVGVLMPAACRVLGVPLGVFVREVATPTLAASVPAAVAAVLLRAYAPPSSIVSILAEGTLVALVYAAVFVSAGLRPSDRVRYFGYVKRLGPGARARAAAL